MPDWFTHSLVGWITGKTTKMDIGLVVIGSLIPDLVKINLAFTWLSIDHQNFFDPIHTPVVAFIIGFIIALFFTNVKKAFIALGAGITTHFVLDFFLVHVSGGMKLLFPFSWEKWQYYLIQSDDYRMTIVAIVVALLIYVVYWYYNKQSRRATDKS